MKNWKSLLAFLIFICGYVYTIYAPLSDGAIEVAGYIALWSSLFMMLRSDLTADMINRIIDKMPSK